MDAIDNEPDEDILYCNAVKYADQNKKAMRDFETAMNDFAGRPPTPIKRFKVRDEFRGTFATGFNVSRTNFAPPPFKEFHQANESQASFNPACTTDSFNKNMQTPDRG